MSEPQPRRGVAKENRQYCRSTLEPHKIPVDVRFTNALIATDSEKKFAARPFPDSRISKPTSHRRAIRETCQHCRSKLEPHKVPVDVRFTDASMATERQKKIRR